jgi:hypothetical protein
MKENNRLSSSNKFAFSPQVFQNRKDIAEERKIKLKSSIL